MRIARAALPQLYKVFDKNSDLLLAKGKLSDADLTLLKMVEKLVEIEAHLGKRPLTIEEKSLLLDIEKEVEKDVI